jgi:hypothetical protein
MTLFGTEREPNRSSDGLTSLSDDLAKRAPSAAVIRIADDLGIDPRALAAEIPEDTLLRTRYPAIEERTADGKRLWKHPVYAS